MDYQNKQHKFLYFNGRREHPLVIKNYLNEFHHQITRHVPNFKDKLISRLAEQRQPNSAQPSQKKSRSQSQEELAQLAAVKPLLLPVRRDQTASSL